MCNIDELFAMLSWNNTEEIQQKGIESAREVKSLCVFFRPNRKDIWENCAKVLCERSDDELRPYIKNMLEWLEDINDPGATLIEERLHKFPAEKILEHYTHALEKAILTDDNMWTGCLAEFAKDDSVLFDNLSNDHRQLVMDILTSPEKDHREKLIKIIKDREAQSNEKAKRDMENYISKVGDNLNDEQRAFLRRLVQG
ncbi:MAG: DUF5071 domain-containing protein [Clostridia bacterium]|nr:DUF5071 domain-containing protein [Clostridia bacterium]